MRKSRIEKKCKCGKLFFAVPSQLKNGKGKFCSLLCKYEYSIPVILNPIKKGEHRGKKTEFKKGMVAWHKGTKGKVFPWNKGSKGLTKPNKTSFKKGHIPWTTRKKHMVDEKHPMWKGDKVGYDALHTWIYRKMGRPMKCEECGFESDNPNKIHWSNISGEYKRDLSDWMRLCAKCHHAYDRISEKSWMTRKGTHV